MGSLTPARIEGYVVNNGVHGIKYFGDIFRQAPMKAAIRSGSLSVLRQVQSDLNVNAALRDEEWKMMDEAVLNAYRDPLVAASDLFGQNLRFNVPNAMGVTVLEWEDLGDVGDASISMYAGTPPGEDIAEYSLKGLPLPIISHGFSLDERVLEASRNRGLALDTTGVERSTRSVAVAIDNLFFNGNFGYGGYQVFGYTTHPARNTGALTADWSLPGTSGETILGDVLAMLQAAYNDLIDGPFMLYVPRGYHTKLSGEFKANSDKSIIQRLREIDGLIDVRRSARLTGNNVVLVAMLREVVDAVVGFLPTLVEWPEQGGAINRFKVMSIVVPRVKQDPTGKSGIVHFSI
jgi:uncharacterized linocin/CFP29 family protein